MRIILRIIFLYYTRSTEKFNWISLNSGQFHLYKWRGCKIFSNWDLWVSTHEFNVYLFQKYKPDIFNKKVLKLSNKNVGLNVGLNKTEKAVLGLLIEDSDRTADMIATEIGVTKRTIERTLVSLQKKEK